MKAVRCDSQDNYSNGKAAEILLEVEVLIHRDKDIKLSGSHLEKIAVVSARPSHFRHSPHVVPFDVGLETAINALVEQDPKWGQELSPWPPPRRR